MSEIETDAAVNEPAPAVPGGGAPPVSERPLLVGLKRGIARRCPTCGVGPLFRSYLKIQDQCPHCGADNARYPSDDAPPYVTIFLVGHLTLPPMLWFGESSSWSVGVLLAIFLPLIVLLSVAILPFAKGAVVGLEWAWDIVRTDVRQNETDTGVAIAQQGPAGGAVVDDQIAAAVANQITPGSAG